MSVTCNAHVDLNLLEQGLPLSSNTYLTDTFPPTCVLLSPVVWVASVTARTRLTVRILIEL